MHTVPGQMGKPNLDLVPGKFLPQHSAEQADDGNALNHGDTSCKLFYKSTTRISPNRAALALGLMRHALP